MPTTSRKRAPRHSSKLALTRVVGEARPRAPAEAALEALFDRLAGLERETAALSESLRRFRDEWRARVGVVEDELFAARRLEERILRLAAEAEQWGAAEVTRTPEGRRKRKRPSSPSAPPSPSVAPPPAEPWMDLKELYRLVARRLHPDLARTDAERARRSELLARVNAAYARGDRVLLELVHARSLTEADASDVTPEKRESHAERRLATLEPIAASLEKELAILRASSEFRDLEKARVTSEAGRDYFAGASYEARRQARAAVDRALGRAAELAGAVIGRRKSAGARSSGPLPALLRAAVRGIERQRVGADARRLADDLRRLSAREPWLAALALLAFFGEASAEPPPGLASLAATGERYESLRDDWPKAPPFERALVRLPPFLEVGLRAYEHRLAFGLQLRRRELVAGVRVALRSEELLPLSRRVFERLGPREDCARCREPVFLVHVFRTRGLDVVHGLLCPACTAVQRSYRSAGRPEGLEALAPYAVALGAVREHVVRLGNADVVLELLPEEQRRLTARGLVERLDDLYLGAISPDLVRYVRLREGRKTLAPSARVRPNATLRVVLTDGAPLSNAELPRALRELAPRLGATGPVARPLGVGFVGPIR